MRHKEHHNEAFDTRRETAKAAIESNQHHVYGCEQDHNHDKMEGVRAKRGKGTSKKKKKCC